MKNEQAMSLLPPATKLGQGNIFRSVCQDSVGGGGGGGCLLGDTGNKRAVLILLECILVHCATEVTSLYPLWSHIQTDQCQICLGLLGELHVKIY